MSSLGIDCSEPIETRKKYGVVSHTLTRTTAMRGQLMNGSHEKTLPPKSHGTWMPNSCVDDAEVVVQEARPHEQREEAGDRLGDDEHER